jgi:hypothetical protein
MSETRVPEPRADKRCKGRQRMDFNRNASQRELIGQNKPPRSRGGAFSQMFNYFPEMLILERKIDGAFKGSSDIFRASPATALRFSASWKKFPAATMLRTG